MPLNINGTGTKYYGKRALLPDGSYITTEWMIFFYIPIFPLASYRVRPIHNPNKNPIFSSERYETRRIALCRSQVLNTYLIMVPVILIFLPLVIFWGNETLYQGYAVFVLVTTILCLIFASIFMRET